MTDIYSLLKDRMGDNDVIYVTADEMKQLVCGVKEPYDPKPEAPIKAKETRVGSGFLKGLHTSRIEFDHHAPEYLRELEEWRKRQEIHNKRTALEICGPNKSYKIVLGNDPTR